MDFNEFKQHRHDCYVAENGFLFWKISNGTQFYPGILSGGGSMMIVHIMVTEGEMTVTVGVKSHTITKGWYAHMIDCAEIEFGSASMDVSAYITCCTDRYTAMLMKNAHPMPLSLILHIREQPLEQLPPDTIELIAHRMECIGDTCRNTEHIFHNEMTKCAIWMHLLDIADIYIRRKQRNHIPSGRKKELLISFMDMLQQNVHAERSVGFYASALCVTPQYLNRIVSSFTKKTVHEWICLTLVGEIAKRLENTDDSMQQIASAFCFPDQATLTKFYKRQTGYSLSEYRKKRSIK